MTARIYRSVLVAWLYWLPVLVLQAAEPRHVILISIDGLLPAFVVPGNESTNCPTLAQLRDSGSYARAAIAVYPSFTYPGHATIVTGVMPTRHGIFDNALIVAPGVEGRGYWFAHDLRAPALWDLAGRAGLSVATLSWPSTAGASNILWNLAEFWPSAEGSRDTLTRQYSTPGLFESLPRFDPISWDKFVTDQAVAIITNHQPRLLLVHLVEPDKIQHRRGRTAPDLAAAMQRVDQHVARIMTAVKQAAFGDRTTFLVMGDHGFSNVDQMIAPNILLVKAGLITLRDNKVKSWRVTIHPTGGSAAVYLKDPTDEKSAAAARQVFETAAKYFQIVERSEGIRAGGTAEAAFFLEAAPGHLFSGSVTQPTLVRRSSVKGAHGYLPSQPEMHTAFIAAGDGIQPGVILKQIRLVDIAPTAARLLGLQFATSDGRVLREILAEPGNGPPNPD